MITIIIGDVIRYDCVDIGAIFGLLCTASHVTVILSSDWLTCNK